LLFIGSLAPQLVAIFLSFATGLSSWIENTVKTLQEGTMATIRRITAFVTSLDDRPGSLLELMTLLKETKVNLAGLWGYTMGPGQAEVLLVAKDDKKLHAALVKAGRQFTQRSAFLLKGTDRVGALLETLRTFAEAEINLEAANAIAIGGKFGAYFWMKEEEIARAERALGLTK
jgi:prephenate dehydratase